MAEVNKRACLLGSWIKVTTTPCANKYPATLSFSTGTYRGARGPEQGMVTWDAGIYRIEDQASLVVGTATDELLTYLFTCEGDHFEFTDEDGCQVQYRRA